MRYPVITVDGPSGVGKGTLCSRLAHTLGYQLLDSGALYRIVGLKASQASLLDNIKLDEQAIATLTARLNIEFVTEAVGEKAPTVQVMVDGEKVGNEIRNETVGGYASRVAALPKVRASLLALQTDMAQIAGLVADGRDMGTVVFPDADAKIFLTASAEARAQRRVSQLQDSGQEVDYDAILETIRARDTRDETRSASPSKPATDALVIDSSNLDAETVFDTVKKFCQSRGISFSA